MRAKAAEPKYGIGDVVDYRDHQDRPQTGRVVSIEATWPSWGKGDPYITYSLHHPTYHRNNFYGGEDRIAGYASTLHPHLLISN